MSKTKFTEEDKSKLTISERASYDAQVNFCSMLMILTVLGVPCVGVSSIAYFIWSNNFTLFLAMSTTLLEILSVSLLIFSLVGFYNNIKKFKEKVSTR